MAPKFDETTRKELEKPPLELVVCQVRFPTILALANGQAPEEFHRRLPQYPVVIPKQKVEVVLDPVTQRVTSSPTTFWTFEDEDSRWTVSLGPTFVALETRNYRRFSEFIATFEQVVGVAREAYDLRVRERIGLRYVDRISRSRCPNLPEDWTTKIEPRLLGWRTLLEDDEGMHASGEFRISKGDRILAIRVLFANAGFPGVSEDELVLDFDCYTEKRDKFDPVAECLEEFRTAGYQAFRWAMDDLIDYFPEAQQHA